jgi:hypothetical protein
MMGPASSYELTLRLSGERKQLFRPAAVENCPQKLSRLAE